MVKNKLARITEQAGSISPAGDSVLTRIHAQYCEGLKAGEYTAFYDNAERVLRTQIGPICEAIKTECDTISRTRGDRGTVSEAHKQAILSIRAQARQLKNVEHEDFKRALRNVALTCPDRGGEAAAKRVDADVWQSMGRTVDHMYNLAKKMKRRAWGLTVPLQERNPALTYAVDFADPENSDSDGAIVDSEVESDSQ